MHGSVRRRGPAAPGGRPRARPWTFVLELGVGADGRRRQLQRSGFATKREAQEAMQAEVQRRSAGVVIDAGRLSMLQFLRDRWLPGLVRVRDSTHRSYAHHIQRYLVPMLGGRQLADLTTPDVNALTAQLGKGKDRGGLGLAPQTVRLVHATLRVALADAVRWGLVPSNVAVGAQLPRCRSVALPR